MSKRTRKKATFNPEFLAYCSISFSEAELGCEYFNENKYSCLSKAYFVGFPRFDLIKQISQEKSDKLTFLYTPRWAVDLKYNHNTHWFDYFEPLMDFFSSHKEYNLIIRPHPGMFSNFIRRGIMTEEDVQNLKELVNSYTNIKFDTNKDYLKTFEDSDILISDMTSLLIEWFLTGKPIIFCDEYIHLNEIGREISQFFYQINNAEELINTIKKVSVVDENKEARLKLVQKNKKTFGDNVSAKIKESLINYINEQ